MSEQRLEASLDLDRMSPIEIVNLIQSEDATVAPAVAAESERIAQAIDQISERLASGGRLFYVGAGTSGRLAMVDAAEVPPTYGVPPDLVQVIMAGGDAAFLGAVEGAEDSEEAAIEEVGRRVTADDALVGVAASGTTPFTVAAMRKANLIGALTIGITSAPGSPLTREVDIPIVPRTGAEVVMGSSRMKSGTAQKMILNTISTGVMVRLGRVYSNLMIDMPATNAKLRRRARRMVELAAGVGEGEAGTALERAGGEVRIAVLMAKKGISRDDASRLLEQHGGRLREALEA